DQGHARDALRARVRGREGRPRRGRSAARGDADRECDPRGVPGEPGTPVGARPAARDGTGARTPRRASTFSAGRAMSAGLPRSTIGRCISSGAPLLLSRWLTRPAGQVRLPLPFLSAPGVPPPLGIVDANGNGRLDRGEVRRTHDGLGFRAHPAKTARNLAVPGEDTRSVFQKIAAEDIAGELFTGDVNGRDVLKFLIL